MKPSVCRIVLFKGYDSNGIKEHPAIITKVWNDNCVNLTAFIDGMAPMTFADVLQEGENLTNPHCWAWPPRV